MKYLNALNSIDEVGSKSLQKLLAHFGSGEKIWNAGETELLQAGVSQKLTSAIIQKRPLIDPEKQWDYLKNEGITIITLDSPEYPPLLKEISSPPFILYCKGNISLLKQNCISIVGSRTFTSYGKMAAEKISFELARNRLCIVSGLAFGIDAIAHQGALEAQGKTIAVLGNGLDDICISPRANFNLSREILAGDGLLVSEFSPRVQASKFTFPMRNRIIAGLSKATIVVEANEKSGSLITANYALDFNRDIFAVPGSIFSPQSEGTNALIKKGAKLVSGIKDILEDLQLDKDLVSPIPKNTETEKEPVLTDDEKAVFTILSRDPMHINQIIKQTALESGKISSIITMLEIKGVVRNMGGQNYIRL